MNDTSSLCPLLVVRGAAKAIDFYQRALGARLLAVREHGAERRIAHADLALGGVRFALTEELRGWNSDAPESLGGSAVVLQLWVADAAVTLASLCNAGASVVFPLQVFEGERMARVRDPYGHLWLLRQPQHLVQPLQPLQESRQGQAAPSAPPSGPPTKEASTINAAPALEQAPSAGSGVERRAAHLHLILGPVGAGKSTFARALAHQRSAIRLTLDDWMVTLFSPDRPATGLPEWYRERAERCIEQIWKLSLQLAARGDDVVLELGLLRREQRERFYSRVDAAELPLTVHVLDAPREVRRARVLERNRERGETFSMVVPPEIFELASDLWQPPDADEHAARDIRLCNTDAG